MRKHLKTFLAELEQEGSGLPRFVVAEFERYLRCGILANGFVRVRCTTCGDELFVAFSCKSRGICPSAPSSPGSGSGHASKASAARGQARSRSSSGSAAR